MPSQSKYRATVIFYFIMVAIFVIMTASLPFIFEKKLIEKASEKSKPHSDNADIWGKFPGRLKTKIEHIFRFFNYTTNVNDDSTIKQMNHSNVTLIFHETVKYSNFSYDDRKDEINFKAYTSFQLTNTSQEKINLPSLGMMELFQTLSNPPAYQKGLVAVDFLLKTTMIPVYEFERQVFVSKYYESFFGNYPGREERVMNAILFNIDSQKRRNIYYHKKHGMYNFLLMYKWVRLIKNDTEIKKAVWLHQELGLSDEEVNFIIGKQSFLYKLFDVYYTNTIEKYNCPKTGCELIYTQFAEGSILANFTVKSIAQINKLIYPNSFVFKTPEMNIFYDKYYKHRGIPFDDLKLQSKQLKLFFGNNPNLRLTEPQNLISLLTMNNTNGAYEGYEKYLINSMYQLNFMTDYIIKYLPSIYINPSFIHDKKQYQISGLSKAYSNFLYIYIDKMMAPFYKKYDILFSEIVSPVVFNKYPKNETDDFCAKSLQPIIDDGKRVLKICATKEFNFMNKEGLRNWMRLYPCSYLGEAYCNVTFYDQFVVNSTIRKDEIKRIFDETYFGNFIKQGGNELKEKYLCVNVSCLGDELVQKQFWNSNFTRNPPTEDGIKANSIYYWNKDIIDQPLEFYYFLEKFKFNDEDVSIQLREALHTYYNASFNLLEREYSQALVHKYQLEIIRTLYEYNISYSVYAFDYNMRDVTNFFKLMDKLFEKFIFTEKFITSYEPMNVIKGNYIEDKFYIDLLASGPYYNNFKPKLNKSTGFVKNIHEIISDSPQYEDYTIVTSRADTTNVMRNIKKMNGHQIYSIKKEEYSIYLQKYIYVAAPLYRSELLYYDKNKWVTDGYQFPIKDRDNIYYFDEISSKKFKFDEDGSKSYGKLKCFNYKLDDTDLVQGLREEGEDENNTIYSYSTQKFNKPIFVSTTNKNYSYKINNEEKDNYMCIDKYTNLVLDSSFTLIYALDTKGFNFLNKKVGEAKKMPIFEYTRKFSIDEDSYNSNFSNVKTYYLIRLIIIIVGVSLIAIMLILGILFAVQCNKEVEEIEVDDEFREPGLIPKNMRDSNASSQD